MRCSCGSASTLLFCDLLNMWTSWQCWLAGICSWLVLKAYFGSMLSSTVPLFTVGVDSAVLKCWYNQLLASHNICLSLRIRHLSSSLPPSLSLFPSPPSLSLSLLLYPLFLLFLLYLSLSTPLSFPLPLSLLICPPPSLSPYLPSLFPSVSPLSLIHPFPPLSLSHSISLMEGIIVASLM